MLFLCGSIPSFDNITTWKNLKEMSHTKKRIRFLTLLTALLIILPANNLLAMVSHSIHIKWDYESQDVPDGLELSAYRLYQEGNQVCQFDSPYDFEGNCEFQSDNGRYNFTLTAVFDDGSESPGSAPFPFLLGIDNKAQASVIAVLGLLLE